MITLFKHACLNLLFLTPLMGVNEFNTPEYPADADLKTLVVIVKNIKNQNGQIHVALYNCKENFLKKHWRGETLDAKSGEVRIEFSNIPSGEYAIGIIHDENENLKLDTNFIGIPTEGFGFSNNAKGFLGPPVFEKAKLQVLHDSKTEVTMKYI